MASFDPYQKWLGISASEQPPDHYCLLGLERFESNEQVIEKACVSRIAKLQDLSNGADVELAQKLLNDVARAKLCLTTKADKFKYDLALRKSLSGANKPELVATALPPAVESAAPAVPVASAPVPPTPAVSAPAISAPNISLNQRGAAKEKPSASKIKSKKKVGSKKKSKAKGSSALGLVIGGLAALALTLVAGGIFYSSGVFDKPSNPTAEADYFDEDWEADTKQAAKKDSSQKDEQKDKESGLPGFSHLTLSLIHI